MVDLQSGRPSELLAFPPVGWTQQDVHCFAQTFKATISQHRGLNKGNFQTSVTRTHASPPGGGAKAVVIHSIR